jgi:hypothetical protein
MKNFFRLIFLSGLLLLIFGLSLTAKVVKPVLALDTAQLYFEPNSSSLPPNSTIKLMLDAKTNKVSFVQVKINFDKNLVNVASDITTTASLSTTNKLSTPDEANASGQILISLGLTPADWSNPPTGVFEVASIPFKVITNSSNQSTNLSIVDAGVQIVAILNSGGFDYSPFTSSTAQLSLNPTTPPTATPVPTASPIPTNSPNPTNSPEPTPPPVYQCTECPTSVLSRTYGNANCDKKIDIYDYNIWRKSYINYANNQNINTNNNWQADFDCDGRITINDFRVYIINRIKFILGLIK